MNKTVTGKSASHILEFGKYKGQTLGELLHIDPSYILWLSEQLIFVVSPALLNKAKKAVEERDENDDTWGDVFDQADFY